VSLLQPNPSAVEASQPGWVAVLELAAQEVFELMLGSPLPVISEPIAEDGLDITAMVGLAGRLCGVLTIRCSTQTAAKLASKMLGVQDEKAAPDLWDALGELCNMIAGNFKNKIPGLGDGCMLSLPTLITGGDYRCHSLGHSNILPVNFWFDGERIMTTLEIHS